MFEPLWKKCRDVCDGEDAVKLNGEYYLPRPDGMEKNDYAAYLQRAEFFNATGRTLDGIHGLMFMKPVNIEVPENMMQYLLNVDGRGTNIHQFIANSAYYALRDGFGSVLIDAPNADNIKTKKEAEENGILPYLTYFEAKDMFNWHYGEIGRNRTLDKACLHECIEVQNCDDYTYILRDRYKQLSLEEGSYHVRVHNHEGAVIADYEPKKSGRTFNRIQLYTMPSMEPEKPLLIDLVNLNLAWYRKSADLENGAHWTGVPTPYVLGYEPEIEYDENGNEKSRKPIYLGGSTMLTFPQGVTNIGYLEFAGSGLTQLQNMMASDEERMAILGARIISAERKGVEAAETARIHRAGENSVIATFANNLSAIFKNILVSYLGWCSESDINPDDVSVHINTDYDVSQMDSGRLTALVSLWQSGGISKKILFNNFKEGEVIPSEYTFDAMEDEIAEEKESSLMTDKALLEAQNEV